MFKIFKYMKKTVLLLMLLSIAIIIIQVWVDLKIPDYMSDITKLVKTADSEMSDILIAGSLMILCAILSMTLTLVSGYVSAQLAAMFSRDLRSDIFNAVQGFSLEEIDRFSTASLITRSTNDVTQIQDFMSRGILMLFRVPITIGLALMKIVGKHWQWTSLTAGAVVIVLIMVVFIIFYAHPRFRKMQILTDDLNRVTRENLTGIRIVRAYNAEEYQEEKFSEANDRLTTNSLQAERAMTLTWPTMRFMNNALTVGIYCVGAYIIAGCLGTDEALLTFSEMVVFSTYASKVLYSFMDLNMIFMQLPRAAVSAERVNEVLGTEPTIKNGTNLSGEEGQKGTVEFKNVSFSYPGAEDDVLHNISFTANKGETVAFIGATGSGKTTLVNLVPRFYDATEGQILVDGCDVREFNQNALRKKIGYAPQRAVLFTGTVRSNIQYGEYANIGESAEEADSYVKKAINIAQATEFVENMPEKYDAAIARGGSNVSGGQKQRLSVARTVFRRPEIYIFDDTFSALDYKTDRALRAALKEETAGVTTLIVAQRIGTIRDADKIIVLDEGRIVGEGTHSELMKNCEVYREIAYTQLSKEELA